MKRLANAGKSAAGAKRGKIRARHVASVVGFTRLAGKENKMLAINTVAMKPINNHLCRSKFEVGVKFTVLIQLSPGP